MAKYDYSKYGDPDWSNDWTYEKAKERDAMIEDGSSEEFVGWPDLDQCEDMEYWGIHEVNGHLEIDVRRFEYACFRTDHYRFPKELRNRGDYYIPSRKHRHDYTYNYLIDNVNALRADWKNEYEPLFKKILSPKDAQDSYRINTMATLGDSEFYDSVEIGATWAMIQRTEAYDRIIRELNCVFITKVVVEIHRIIFRTLSMELYEKQDYSVCDLMTYCNGRGVRFYDLKNREVYQKYNNICNFLKHNSIKAYNTIKKYNPECLIETKCEYENGMFAAPWLNYKEVDIDRFLEEIVPFLTDFCVKVMNEDPKQAEWDYEDQFIRTIRELRDPGEYLGINAACGMSPFD